VIQDHLAELRSLEGLARFLVAVTSADGSTGTYAMAQALATRLATLAAGARIAQGPPARDDPTPPGGAD
jgi:hypothetical protein